MTSDLRGGASSPISRQMMWMNDSYLFPTRFQLFVSRSVKVTQNAVG